MSPFARRLQRVGGERAIPAPGSYKPSAQTTGVYNSLNGLSQGSSLTVVTGNLTAVSGTTYEAKDFTGLVSVPTNGTNITFRHCRFRGGPGTGNSGLLTCWNTGISNILVEDCTFVPDTPSYWLDAVVGYGYTIRRCDIKWTVDGLGVQNAGADNSSNVVVEANYIHDLALFAPDPNHPNDTDPELGVPNKWPSTHNDGIQIQGGNGTRMIGNFIDGHRGSHWPNWDPTTSDPTTWHPNPYIYLGYGTVTTSAIQITPNNGNCTGLYVDSNWLYGGAVSLNSSRGAAASDGSSPKYAQSGTFTNNQFGHDQGIQSSGGNNTWACAIYTVYAADYTKSNNVYEDNQVGITYKSNSV